MNYDPKTNRIVWDSPEERAVFFEDYPDETWGHEFGREYVIHPKTDEIVFRDTLEPCAEESVAKRPCPLCNKLRRADGCDPCLGRLPGVTYACCGHGKREGYIIFENGIKVSTLKLETEEDIPRYANCEL